MIKNTNGALTMLLSQFRAVCKNAHVKNLAASVLVVSSLAIASDASAAGWPETGSENVTSSVTVDTSDEADTAVTVGEGGDFRISGSAAVTVTDDDLNAGITVNGGSVSMTAADAAEADLSVTLGQGVTVSKGTVTLTTGGSTGNTDVTLNSGVIIGGGAEAASVTLANGAGSGVASLGGEDSVITVNANGTLNLNGTDDASKAVTDGTVNINGGTLAAAYGTVNGDVTVTGGQIRVTDELNLAGRVDLDADSQLVQANDSGNSEIQLTGADSYLSLSRAQLDAYLAADESYKGKITLGNENATLHLTDDSEIVFNDLVGSAEGSVTGANGIISARNMKVSAVDTEAKVMSLAADSLTVDQSSAFSEAAFKTATVTQNLNLVAAADTDLVIREDYVLSGDGTQVGSVAGADIDINGENASFKVVSGQWNVSQNIKVSDSKSDNSVVIGASDESGSASLVLASGKTLEIASGQTVTVGSAGKGILDLSSASLKIGESAAGTLATAANGTLIIGDAALEAALDDTKGYQFTNAGTIRVNGDLDLTDADLAASAGSSGKIENTGLIETAGRVTVTSSGNDGTLDFGGRIKASTVVLNNKTDIGDREEFALQGGSFEVSSGFGGNSRIVMGDTGKDASVTFNGAGTLTANIELDGNALGDTAAGTGTYLNFASGDWTAENREISIIKGAVNIAEDASLSLEEIGFDADSAAADAVLTVEGSLTANTLTAYKTQTVMVSGGDLNVKTLDLAGAQTDTVHVTSAGAVSTGVKQVLSSATAVAEDYRQGAISLDGTSTLVLSDAADLFEEPLTGDEFNNLKKLILGDATAGMISLEGVGADLGDDLNADGTMSYEKASDYDGWNGALDEVTVTGVNEAQTQKSVSWGAVRLAANQTALEIGEQGAVTLSKADNGMFAASSEGKPAGVTLTAADSQLALNGDGQIGSVLSSEASAGDVIIKGNVDVAGTVGSAAKAVGTLSVAENGSVDTAFINVSELTASNAVINVGKTGVKEIDEPLTQNGMLGSAYVAGTLTGSVLNADGVVTAGSDGLILTGSVLEAGTLVLNGDVFAAGVAAPAEPEVPAAPETSAEDETAGNEGDESADTAAEIARLMGGEGTVVEADEGIMLTAAGDESEQVVVPDAPEVSSYAAIMAEKVPYLAQSLTAGAGTALYIGEDLDRSAVLAMARSANGRAAGMIESAVSVDGTDGHLVIDSQFTDKASYDAAVAAGEVASVQLGAGDSLIVTGEAMENGYAITTDGSADIKGTVTLTDVALADGRTYNVISAASGLENIRYVIDSQLFDAVATGGSVSVSYNPDGKAGQALAQTDASIRSLINAYGLSRKEFDADSDDGVGFVTAATRLSYVNAEGNTVADARQIGRVLGSAARITTAGGVPQISMLTQETASRAISERLGFDTAIAATMASSGEGSGVWVMPVYAHHESDDFDAGSMNYGVSADLYGVALGADFGLAPGFKTGILVNIGQGDAESGGDVSDTDNEFDYLGFGIYAGYGISDFSVKADLGYTAVDNDLDQSSAAGALSTSVDSSILIFGIEGRYAFEVNGFEIAPHFGLRYQNLDVDSYDVAYRSGTALRGGSYSADIWTLPLGVSFGAAFTDDGWDIRPALDLAIIPAIGDTDADQDVEFTGMGSASVESDIMDRVNYGLKLGLDAEYGTFGLGLGYSFMGSGSSKNHQLTGNLRYLF